MRPFATLALAVLALTACTAEPNKSAGGTAQGEVLPGSASDAMLPLDTLKSQAPLVPKSEGETTRDAKASGKPAAKPKDAAKSAEAALSEAATVPAPSEEN